MLKITLDFMLPLLYTLALEEDTANSLVLDSVVII